ncbi:hemerythrin domain-containing protein [Uliginosibacterium sp. H1]|uniref:hemerythrin domain-containing protein n=1 Tax=Uliginosibacterium sp. H1 TaxID=3114757 RepID=UPI002E18F93B|nr:hemerythrin domain-containing protein [Uliginosibacterium sp. H1]
MPSTHANPHNVRHAPQQTPHGRVERAQSTDAIRLLRADHKEVEALFDQYERLRSAARKRIVADQICMLLEVHTQIEEEIFYPAVRRMLQLDDLLDEAVVEHASANELIAQIRDDDPEEPYFDARVKVLGEYIQHHVKEEQRELFPRVDASRIDTAALGRRMQARKEALLAGYAPQPA